jgi:hypothetical protein
MRPIEMPIVVWEFLAATNACDSGWIATLFADDCAVDAWGFRASGRTAVTSWSNVELLQCGITLAMIGVRCEHDTTVVRAEATDCGFRYECFLTFRTVGRHIQSIVFSATDTDASRTTEARRVVAHAG